ncbi:hypothetical protein HF086_013463 [Spodoptera exigua]|uniref:SCP domain-containing protein n=1 Tax=Spodoptera exigua TaxID=7107 RepID=A0A922SK82_SPOEX|nr:hypothetical protein HF086_013463 [Spodoptera exigua]
MYTRGALLVLVLFLLNIIVELDTARPWGNKQQFPPHLIPDNALHPRRSVVRRKIVLYHNFFRTKVRPRAANMLLMTWHAGAARQAQAYAEKCQFLKHNDVRENQVPHLGTCGQNLFVAAQKTPCGNYHSITQYPYKIGEPCGDCPNHCLSGSLCTNACHKMDYYSNCPELVSITKEVCERGLCNATCNCAEEKIHRNYPWR